MLFKYVCEESGHILRPNMFGLVAAIVLFAAHTTKVL